MNITLKARGKKEWTLTDDKIIVGNKEILLSTIKKVEHSPVRKLNSFFGAVY